MHFPLFAPPAQATGILPGLLQPGGVALLLVLFGVATAVAYFWHRRDRRRPELHLDVLAIGLLALLTGGFFWRVMVEGGVMMPQGGGDIASFYYPTYLYTAAEIKQGALPLWNPHLFAGMPLAADVQAGFFYPINWVLFQFVNVDYGSVEWLLIFHYWLAASFMYIFLRDLRVGRPGAIVGGVAFAFCGFMTAHFGHLPMIMVAAWLPATLLCLRRAYYTRGAGGWAWAIGAGVSMTMSLLAGHVQIFSYSLMAAGLLWLFLLFDRKPLVGRSVVEWVGKGALSMVVLLGLGAIQLLPSIQLSAQSVRASISYEEAVDFSAQPLTLINMLLPRVFGGSPDTYNPGEWQTTGELGIWRGGNAGAGCGGACFAAGQDACLLCHAGRVGGTDYGW